MRTYIIVFLLMGFFSYAQKNNFNLVVGYGASYFFNDKTLNRYIDNTALVGINYRIRTKNRGFDFNPGINLQNIAYHAHVFKTRLVHVNQRVLSSNLDVLMKLNKKQLLRIGLLLNFVFDSNIFISETDYNSRSYYSFGNDYMRKGYFPTTFQAGITLGICFPFRLFKREQKFDIKLNQLVSSLVNSDFKLSKGVAGADIKVLSTQARPTMLVFALEFNLMRIKKDKKKKEEE